MFKPWRFSSATAASMARKLQPEIDSSTFAGGWAAAVEIGVPPHKPNKSVMRIASVFIATPARCHGTPPRRTPYVQVRTPHYWSAIAPLARSPGRKQDHNEPNKRNADRPPKDKQQLKGQGVWLHWPGRTICALVTSPHRMSYDFFVRRLGDWMN